MTEIETRSRHDVAVRPKRWPLALASAVMVAGLAPGAYFVTSDPGRFFTLGTSDVFRSDVVRELDAKYEETIELVRVDDPTAWDTADEVEDESTVYIDGEVRTDCRVTDAQHDPALSCDSEPRPTESTR